MRICFSVHFWFSKIQDLVYSPIYFFLANYTSIDVTGTIKRINWPTNFLDFSSDLFQSCICIVQSTAKLHISHCTGQKFTTDSILTLLLTIKKKGGGEEWNYLLHWFSYLSKVLRHTISVASFGPCKSINSFPLPELHLILIFPKNFIFSCKY